MVLIATIDQGRHFDYDAPGFVDAFLYKERSLQNRFGMPEYQANIWDYRYMILTGLWLREGGRVVEAVTPLWTEDIGQYYHDLGYPFQDPNKRFLKTLYWYIVREYTVFNAPLNKLGGKCQHPDCSCPTSCQLNVHHGSILAESYVSLERGFHSIVGQEHLHKGMLTVLCETCHTKVTETARTAKKANLRPSPTLFEDNPELFK